MNARLMTAMIALIAIAAIAAGCGGNENASSASGSAGDDSASLSKAAFIKRAEAACLQEREGTFEKVGAYQERHQGEGLSEAKLLKEAIRAAVLSTVEAEIAALRALGPPAEIEAILDEEQATVDEVRGLKRWSKEVGVYFVDTDKKLRAYGLGSCEK